MSASFVIRPPNRKCPKHVKARSRVPYRCSVLVLYSQLFKSLKVGHHSNHREACVLKYKRRYKKDSGDSNWLDDYDFALVASVGVDLLKAAPQHQRWAMVELFLADVMTTLAAELKRVSNVLLIQTSNSEEGTTHQQVGLRF